MQYVCEESLYGEICKGSLQAMFRCITEKTMTGVTKNKSSLFKQNIFSTKSIIEGELDEKTTIYYW